MSRKTIAALLFIWSGSIILGYDLQRYKEINVKQNQKKHKIAGHLVKARTKRRRNIASLGLKSHLYTAKKFSRLEVQDSFNHKPLSLWKPPKT